MSCKAEFSAAITLVFNVAWSFRNHSNILILISFDQFIATMLNKIIHDKSIFFSFKRILKQNGILAQWVQNFQFPF